MKRVTFDSQIVDKRAACHSNDIFPVTDPDLDLGDVCPLPDIPAGSAAFSSASGKTLRHRNATVSAGPAHTATREVRRELMLSQYNRVIWPHDVADEEEEGKEQPPKCIFANSVARKTCHEQYGLTLPAYMRETNRVKGCMCTERWNKQLKVEVKYPAQSTLGGRYSSSSFRSSSLSPSLPRSGRHLSPSPRSAPDSRRHHSLSPRLGTGGERKGSTEVSRPSQPVDIAYNEGHRRRAATTPSIPITELRNSSKNVPQAEIYVSF